MIQTVPHWLSVLLIAACIAPVCCRDRTPDSITIAVPFELGTVDPHAKDKLGSASILSNIYEGLVTTDEQLGIRPGLAVSWESPDPYTWIFRLRTSVKFHSGKPFSAADVVFSFQRILQSSNLELRGSYLTNIAGVKDLDPETVEIRTVVPTQILLNKLSHIPIIPEGASPATLASAADGTGPYKLESWKQGDFVRLQRNDSYWGVSPRIRTVTFLLARKADEAMKGLLSGQCQFIRADSRKSVAAARESGRFEVLQHDNPFVKYLGFNLSHPVFGEQKVRQAIQLAVDRKKLVLGLSSYAEAAGQLVPRFVFGFNPAIAPAQTNVQQARALLAQSGFENGISAPLYARNITAEAASLLAEQLQPAGIRMEVRVLPDAEFFARLENGQADVWLNSAGCSTGDSSDLFDSLIHSRDPERHYGMQNFTHFSNAELDAKIERSSAIEDPDDRLNMLQQIMASAMEELIFVPLYNDQDIYIMDRSFRWSPRSDSYILADAISVDR